MATTRKVETKKYIKLKIELAGDIGPTALVGHRLAIIQGIAK